MLGFEEMFLYALALVWITFATIEDVRKREVANWLNFSLVIFALGFRFFFSWFNGDFNFFYQGLVGYGIFLVLGNLFYYARIFAGGDAKLMMSLGAILPFYYNFSSNLQIFVAFIFLFFFVGAVYGLFFSLFLVFRNRKAFVKEFKKQLKKHKIIVVLMFILGVSFLLVSFYYEFFLFFGIFTFVSPYFYLYAKAIDKVCMVRNIKVENLQEGDWLFEKVKVGRILIKPSWDGLSKSEIKKIKSKYKKIKIRQGIPFVPVFLMSFILLIGLVYFNILRNFQIFIF